ncbi:MAG: hypothetical protein M0Q13_10420 [Methanothrix sp.]|jgi:hypothetical protein|nr:hypothetical protein [Methanothrix sp.]
MDNEIGLDGWLLYFKTKVDLHENEWKFLSAVHIPEVAQLEQLRCGPKEKFLENARELMRERMQYILAMDTQLRLCRNEAKKYTEKYSEDPRCKSLEQLCGELHRISAGVMFCYNQVEEFLQKTLSPDEYEGLRKDIINDILLAGKIARGDV